MKREPSEGIIDVKLNDDTLELELTREGWERLLELRDMMMDENPTGDLGYVVAAAMRALIAELESLN